MPLSFEQLVSIWAVLEQPGQRYQGKLGSGGAAGVLNLIGVAGAGTGETCGARSHAQTFEAF